MHPPSQQPHAQCTSCQDGLAGATREVFKPAFMAAGLHGSRAILRIQFCSCQGHSLLSRTHVIGHGGSSLQGSCKPAPPCQGCCWNTGPCKQYAPPCFARWWAAQAKGMPWFCWMTLQAGILSLCSGFHTDSHAPKFDQIKHHDRVYVPATDWIASVHLREHTLVIPGGKNAHWWKNVQLQRCLLFHVGSRAFCCWPRAYQNQSTCNLWPLEFGFWVGFTVNTGALWGLVLDWLESSKPKQYRSPDLKLTVDGVTVTLWEAVTWLAISWQLLQQPCTTSSCSAMLQQLVFQPVGASDIMEDWLEFAFDYLNDNITITLVQDLNIICM